MAVTSSTVTTAAMPEQESQPTTTSPLKALPGELRNRIYRLVTGGNLLVPAVTATTKTRMPVDIPMEVRGFKHHLPGLAATCRQIRSEVMEIHYVESTFVFYPTDDIKDSKRAVKAWMRPLGSNIEKVTSVAAAFTTKGGREAVITATISAENRVTFEVNDVLAHLCTCPLLIQHHVLKNLTRRRELLERAAQVCCIELYEHFQHRDRPYGFQFDMLQARRECSGKCGRKNWGR